VSPATPPPVDRDLIAEILVELLRTPSPTGRTDQAVQLVGDRVTAMGLSCEVTRRGALRIAVHGADDGPQRAVIAHVDTLGCMVRSIRGDGRLQIVPIGTWSARVAEGARVTLFTDDLDRPPLTGTILPLKSAGHRWHREIDTQPVGWEFLELRLDERVGSAADVAAHGVQVGDIIGVDASPVITSSGFVKARHLDDKAGIAATLGALDAFRRLGDGPVLPAQILITTSEEVGHGASHGLGADVAELVVVDNAVVADGQTSTEDAVTIAMLDRHGPFDYHLSRHLIALCQAHDIPHHRDVFDHYRSDAAAALEAGMATRAALIGFGVDASHAWERTHLDGLVHLAELLVHYLRSDLTLSDWDRTPGGPLGEFPSSSVQPAPMQGPQ
jgi:peptidase M42 family hydrolase